MVVNNNSTFGSGSLQILIAEYGFYEENKYKNTDTHKSRTTTAKEALNK